MKNIKVKTATKTPWHLYAMVVFFAFIYANGVYDYFMMLSHNIDYYNSKHYGEAVFQYFTNYPISLLVLYTINIFSGLISPILLLIRTKLVMWVSFTSAVTMSLLEIFTFSFRNRWNVFGAYISLFDIALLIITWGLFIYCRTLIKRDILQ